MCKNYFRSVRENARPLRGWKQASTAPGTEVRTGPRVNAFITADLIDTALQRTTTSSPSKTFAAAQHFRTIGANKNK